MYEFLGAAMLGVLMLVAFYVAVGAWNLACDVWWWFDRRFGFTSYGRIAKRHREKASA